MAEEILLLYEGKTGRRGESGGGGGGYSITCEKHFPEVTKTQNSQKMWLSPVIHKLRWMILRV